MQPVPESFTPFCKLQKEAAAARRRAESVGGTVRQTVHVRVRDYEAEVHQRPHVKQMGLMIDTGATSHIIADISRFEKFDEGFQSETHFVELADRMRCSWVAERRGDAVVVLIDNRGRLP